MRTGNARSFPNGTEKLSTPPGFVCLSSFKLRRQQTEEAPRDTETVSNIPNIVDVEKLKRDCLQKPWLYGSQITPKQKELDSAIEMNIPMKACLPKEVVRGCSSCPNCVKVISCWQPEEPHRPVLEEAPVFHPTEEEFKETLKYVASIRKKAEKIGMCRIVPPLSWKPPNLTGENSAYDNLEFETDIQQVHELQDRFSKKKKFRVQEERKFKRRKVQVGSSEDGSPDEHSESLIPDPGPKLTLKAYEKYADDFKSQYFSKKEMAISSACNLNNYQEGWVPSVEDVEGEYWRIVEHPSEEIEVLQSSHVDSGVPSIEFPVDNRSSETPQYPDYMASGWNLNNTSKVPGSLLCYESVETSASLRPQLSAGMCFSSVCWKVDKHHLYSLCYAHLGSPKIWYVVPGRFCYKFASFVKKHFPDSLEHPELLYGNMPHFSPSSLIAEGIPVYRCVQQPGEFVVIFPRAYNSQFDCGFSCSEAVSFAPFDWLPVGQQIVELCSQQCIRTSISVDKLLLGAAAEAALAQWQRVLLLNKIMSDQIPWATVCGEEGVLTKALKSRVKHEAIRRQYMCRSLPSQKMVKNFDLHVKQECNICLYDLHFSAIGCSCSPGRYACTRHAMDLCSCPWTSRYLLIRYSIDELHLLVEALEGKLDSVFKWGREYLGLKVSSGYFRGVFGIPNKDESPTYLKAAEPVSVSPVRRNHTVARVSKTEQNDGQVVLTKVNSDSCSRQDTHKPEHSNSNNRKRELNNSASYQSGVILIEDDE